MNFTAGGEYCLFNAVTSKLTKTYANEFRKMLLLHDRDDVERGGVPREHSFVSSVWRAAPAAAYPNISCTFKEKAGPNDLGVFNLETTGKFINEHGLIKHDEIGPYGDDTWYLDDIIKETYKRTGEKKGIFIFAGCTSGFKQAVTKANLNSAIEKAISDAQRLIYLAEIEYGTTVSALNKKKLMRINPDLIPTNYGMSRSVAQPDPTSMAALAAATGDEIDVLFSDIADRDPEDYKKALSMLKP
jgi:hypothetical protein